MVGMGMLPLSQRLAKAHYSMLLLLPLVVDVVFECVRSVIVLREAFSTRAYAADRPQPATKTHN